MLFYYYIMKKKTFNQFFKENTEKKFNTQMNEGQKERYPSPIH